MLKRYNIVTSSPTSAALIGSSGVDIKYLDNGIARCYVSSVCKVPGGAEAIIMNVAVNGGASGGMVAVGVYRNNTVLDGAFMTVAPGDTLWVDTKQAMEAGDELYVGSDNDKVSITVSCDIAPIIGGVSEDSSVSSEAQGE